MINLLAIDWSFDPVAFNLFGLEIRYYGLMWALMILVAAKLFDFFFQREGYDAKLSESIFVYGTLGTIIGSRVGHCLFYEPEHFLANPLEIITGIRDGGMASHGAAIGLIIGLWLFSRKYKMPLIWSLDRIMIATGIGAALIRLGNLFNSEIFGYPTDLPWGFRFLDSSLWQRVAAPMACHPTQIYEAISYLVVFVVLWVMYIKYDIGRRYPAVLFGVGVIGAFGARFMIEFLKFEQVEFEKGMILDMGQWLSIPFLIVGVASVIYGVKNGPIEVVQSAKSKNKK